MFRRSAHVLTIVTLVTGFLVSPQGMASDVIANANAGTLLAVEYLRGGQPFLLAEDRGTSMTSMNSVARIPRIQTAANTMDPWHGASSLSADIDMFDAAALSFGNQGTNDPWLMTLVGAGLIILQLRRKQKGLQQRMLAPG